MGVNPQLLRRTEMFAGLDSVDVGAIADMSRMRWFERGEPLYSQGEESESFFVIFDGAVKVSRVSSSGRAMVVDFRGPGDMVGSRAIVADRLHTDAASAIEDALVAVIPLEEVGDLLASRPGAGISLARHFARQLEVREAKVAALSTKRVHQRLGVGLLDLSSTLGAAVDDVVVINARLTQAEVADWIGTTRETASTLLNGLRRAGFIDIVSRRIHVRDRDAISAYAARDELPANLGDLVRGSRRDTSLARSA